MPLVLKAPSPLRTACSFFGLIRAVCASFSIILGLLQIFTVLLVGLERFLSQSSRLIRVFCSLFRNSSICFERLAPVLEFSNLFRVVLEFSNPFRAVCSLFSNSQVSFDRFVLCSQIFVVSFERFALFFWSLSLGLLFVSQSCEAYSSGMLLVLSSRLLFVHKFSHVF